VVVVLWVMMMLQLLLLPLCLVPCLQACRIFYDKIIF